MSTGKNNGFLWALIMIIIAVLSLSGCSKDDSKKTDEKIMISDYESQNDITQSETKTDSEGTDSKENDNNTKDTDTSSEDTLDENGYKIPEYVNDDSDDAKNCKEKMIKLSGKKSDVYKIDEDCYYRGDKFFLFIHSGSIITGDIADTVENTMERLEELYGMSYDNLDHLTVYPWRREYFQSVSYNGLNVDNEKVSILILPESNDGTVEVATDSIALLFDKDMDSESADFAHVYHELTHCLRRRQGGFMGDIFEEGIALYSEDFLSRENKLANWNIVQYIKADGYEPIYDDSKLLSEPEEEYKNIEYDDQKVEQPEYQYGYRLANFLVENYGIDIFKKISEISNKYDYDYGYVDIEIEIIKEATSDDVFDRFAEWVKNNWEKHSKDYLDYINQFEPVEE